MAFAHSLPRTSWQGAPVTRRSRRSAFIRYFDATPPGIVCPHFHVLAHANGCPFRCDYCYLQLTFRRNSAPVVFTNLADLERDVERFLQRDEPSVLNAGELADALAFDCVTGLVSRLVPLFAAQRKHKLLLLTKSANVEPLLRLEHAQQTIVSFSLNSEAAASRFEHGAPPPAARLEAARALGDVGYRVRLRVDPMIPLADWHDSYRRLAAMICCMTRPERVTLGTIRFFRSLPRFSRDGREVYSYATSRDGPDGRLRLPLEKRVEMYHTVIGGLAGTTVALCKETEEAWRLTSLDPRRCLCNCAL